MISSTPSVARPDPGSVISTSALRKEYHFHRQQPGFSGALRSLVRRRRETRVAVETLDLDIGRGELVGLLGRNGAGKTTTLKMLSGLLRPTSGEVQVLGHQPDRRGYDFLRRIAVVLGQKSMLWWDVSTLDSLRLHQAMYDLPTAQFDHSVVELSTLLDLTPLLDVPVRKLSLGERMKCELVVALLHQPEVLFLDEPTIGLDVISKATIRSFLAKINTEHGTTIILTSHDMDDVAELCRRVVLIDHGTLQFDGSLSDLVHRTRPHKSITLTFTGRATLPSTLPTGVVLIEHDASVAGTRVVLQVERDAGPSVLAIAPQWGELVDLEVRDADLDEVMRAVLSGDDVATGEPRSTGDTR